jgi:hypothetical protein
LFPTSQLTANIETDGGPMPLGDLSYFLYLFRALYVAAREEMTSSGQFQIESIDQVNRFARLVAKRIGTSAHQFADFASRKLSDQEDIRVVNIYRQNPLFVVFEGIGLSLVTCAIIAGGSFALNQDTIELPSLRTMITKIQSAVSGQRRD